ncbi:MAG: hypothetical protein WCS93_00600 [Candidatus Delongbacteria bacterium]|jgi:hypothetical protein|nr:hypothetical protein [Candidatus Delongbacteria bacterium]
MMRYFKLLVFFLTAALLFSQEGLSDEEKALFKTNVIVPAPSEIIMALDMLSDVKWKEVVTYDKSTNYSDNYKIALNLGVRVAQGFIAIQAQDRKNTGEMFRICRDLAENFGAKSDMFVNEQQIIKLLDENNWTELRSILDDIHLKVKDEMYKYDPDFVELASVGGWMEGLHIVSKALKSNYSPDASVILYQPELIQYFSEAVKNIKTGNSNNPEVKEIAVMMPEIGRLTEVGSGNPIPSENVARLYEISSRINSLIVSQGKTDGGPADAGEDPQKWFFIYGAIAIIFVILFFTRRKKGGSNE